ncbi:MAG: hypothetical protein GEV03_21545 [Streptosporangiales bacterium]|nr:hypothetical protein [Streptosporangiales bacterium]
MRSPFRSPGHRLAVPAVAATLATILAAAGCGSGGDTGSAATLDPQNPVTIKVGEVAGIPSAFLTYGKNQGFFADRGLELDIETAAGGAAIIPGVVSDDYAIGGSNVVSVALGTSKGLPIRMVTSGTGVGDSTKEDFSAILVPGDGDIREASDLAGKTIAVNTLKNISEVTVKTALEKHGVDPASVKFTELEFPEMLPALERGEVDAAHVIEPFATLGSQQGLRAVSWPYVESKPGMQIGSYVTSQRYLEERPEVVEAFRAGIADTAAAIEKDPDAFRKALPELTELSPEAADRAVLPVWRASIDKDTLTFVVQQMVKYGLIDKPVEVEQIIAPGSTS